MELGRGFLDYFGGWPYDGDRTRVAWRRRSLFGIGMQEIVLICVIALIVVGPKKMPELARALGKGYGEFRRAFEEMKRNVETDFQTDEIRRSLLDLPPRPTAFPSAPPVPSESLLTQPPAAEAGSDPIPYPAVMDASPPPPEQAATPPPDPPPPSGQAHG
ncbi:MAG: Sec-independent protein translocase protein TatB [Candidatus Methylomirabilia bacterium]